MERTYYLAEWLADDALTDDGLASDRMENLPCAALDEAKAVAMAGALGSPMYWARVVRVDAVDGMKKYGPSIVNEWINGDWTGWEDRGDN